MDKQVSDYINSKFAECEKAYGIKVISWHDRGSLLTHKSRKNSDFDISFIFIQVNSGGRTINAIHDIVGWGIDAWGWSLDEALNNIVYNHSLLCDGINEIKITFPTKEHSRAHFNYFNDIYLGMDNPMSFRIDPFNEEAVPILRELFEIPSLVLNAFDLIKGYVRKIRYLGQASSYEYLNALWYILMAKQFESGCFAKAMDIRDLCRIYLSPELTEIVLNLLNKYKNAISKNSQIFTIDLLGRYICDEFDAMEPIWNNSGSNHTRQSVIEKTDYLRNIFR